MVSWAIASKVFGLSTSGVRPWARRSGVKVGRQFRQGVEIRAERPRVHPGAAGMEQHQRLARAGLAVPSPHSIEIYIGRHTGDCLLGPDFMTDGASETTALRPASR